MIVQYRVVGRFVRSYTPFKSFPGTTLRGLSALLCAGFLVKILAPSARVVASTVTVFMLVSSSLVVLLSLLLV